VSGGIAFATLVAGQNHVCGSVSSGAMYCWGSNQSGQLGDGTTTNRSVPTLVK
jgi:alpha-tubulin suppressor-like RCC1 family protein